MWMKDLPDFLNRNFRKWDIKQQEFLYNRLTKLLPMMEREIQKKKEGVEHVGC